MDGVDERRSPAREAGIPMGGDDKGQWGLAVACKRFLEAGQ